MSVGVEKFQIIMIISGSRFNALVHLFAVSMRSLHIIDDIYEIDIRWTGLLPPSFLNYLAPTCTNLHEDMQQARAREKNRHRQKSINLSRKPSTKLIFANIQTTDIKGLKEA